MAKATITTCLTTKKFSKLANMHRRIAKALIFFILFANLAWAADMDEIGFAHHATEVQASISGADGQSDVGDTGHIGLKHDSCDHCCHGSAHYVGVPYQTSFDLADNASCAPALRVTTRYSREPEPPLPPPDI